MNKWYSRRWLYIVILIIGIVYVIFSASVSRCIPSPKNPWFLKEYHLVENNLPDGLAVKYLKDSLGVTEVFVSNKSSIPIYFTDWETFRMDENDYKGEPGCPADFKPYFKLINSEVYSWVPSNEIHKIGSWYIRLATLWEKEHFPKDMLGRYLVINEYSTGKLEHKYMYPPELKFESKDGARPQNVIPPKPYQFEIPAYYKNQKIKLFFKVEYSLNPDYKDYGLIQRIKAFFNKCGDSC